MKAHDRPAVVKERTRALSPHPIPSLHSIFVNGLGGWLAALVFDYGG